MSQFEHLFTPLQVGPMRVPNRICETTNTIIRRWPLAAISSPTTVLRRAAADQMNQATQKLFLSINQRSRKAA